MHQPVDCQSNIFVKTSIVNNGKAGLARVHFLSISIFQIQLQFHVFLCRMFLENDNSAVQLCRKRHFVQDVDYFLNIIIT